MEIMKVFYNEAERSNGRSDASKQLYSRVKQRLSVHRNSQKEIDNGRSHA